jgi:hypothetical protein
MRAMPVVAVQPDGRFGGAFEDAADSCRRNADLGGDLRAGMTPPA